MKTRDINLRKNNNVISILLRFTIFLILPLVALPGAEQVCHRFHAEQKADTELENFLYMSISAELLNYELSSTREDRGADYILKIDYRYEDNHMDLELTLLDPGPSETALSSARLSSQIDIRLRELVSQAVEELMSDTSRTPSESKRKRASIEGVLDLKHSDSFVDPGYLKDDGFLLEGSVGLRTPVYLGEFADYMSWGLNGQFSLSLLWLHKRHLLSLGINTSAGRSFKKSNVSGGTLYPASVGGRFLWAYKTGVSQYLGIYAEGGGAPLFLDDDGVLVQFCPYVEAGIDYRLLKMWNTYLDLHVGARTVFEKEMIIFSLEPSIKVNFKL